MGRSKYVAHIFFIALVFLTSYFVFSKVTAQTKPTSSRQDNSLEQQFIQGEARDISINVTQAVVSQQQLGAQEIINSKCVPCHVRSSFDQVEKTRVEWEKNLQEMEAMGVQLSQDQKDVLLEYLLNRNRL